MTYTHTAGYIILHSTYGVTSGNTFNTGELRPASITSSGVIYGSTGSFSHIYGRTSIYTSSLRAASITSSGRIYSNGISATGSAQMSFFRSVYSNTGTFTNGLTVSGSTVMTKANFKVTGASLVIVI